MKLTDIMNGYCELVSGWGMTKVVLYSIGDLYYILDLTQYNLMDAILDPETCFVCTIKYGKIEVFKGEVIR